MSDRTQLVCFTRQLIDSLKDAILGHLNNQIHTVQILYPPRASPVPLLKKRFFLGD